MRVLESSKLKNVILKETLVKYKPVKSLNFNEFSSAAWQSQNWK